MRTKVLASLLILTGSTAALAQIATTPVDPMVEGNAVMTNDMDANMAMDMPMNGSDDAPPPQQ